jgi:hypothetical protein
MFALILPLFFVIVPDERIYPNCSYVLHYANVDFGAKKKALSSLHASRAPLAHICLVHTTACEPPRA